MTAQSLVALALVLAIGAVTVQIAPYIAALLIVL